jgi:opacity protein-like surface antigen
MKKLLILLVVCLASQASLMAQDSRAQVFGGFSAFTFRGDSSTSRLTPVGWQAAVEAKVANHIGVVGDFGGHYKTPDGFDTRLDFYEYMGGVRFHVPVSRVGAFAHALVGAGTVRGGGLSNTSLAMGYGGGVDWNLNDSWSVRLVQADWIPTRFDDTWQTNQFRFGFGLVWKSGS